MAQFDTALVLNVIIGDTLRDHEANRRVIEALEGFRLGNQDAVLAVVLETVLRQMSQSSHGRDLVVGLVDRFTDEARADALARIELTAAGLDEEEIEEALRDYPEEFTPEALEVRYSRHRVKPEDLIGVPFRGPTHQELMDAGPI